MSPSEQLRQSSKGPGGARWSAALDTGPQVPAYEELPERRRRGSRGGPLLCSISLSIKVVTPILGGSSQPREIDKVDVIRPATVRGHLRFWWRATYGHTFQKPEELYKAESELWGCVAAGEQGRRSAVDLVLEVQKAVEEDSSPVTPKTQGAYALWPARQGRDATPVAPRRKPGTCFELKLTAPQQREGQLRDSIRAWLLFGGYGSRTRRGLGSLTVTRDAHDWLPGEATRSALESLFDKKDIFKTPPREAGDTPWLAGAALHIGKMEREAVGAWTTALGWLGEFRQGTTGDAGDRAREPGVGRPSPGRPSITNWPEADKIRHLMRKTASHPPRHNATPAWPRAGFGLPIIGRFQDQARDGGRMEEPDRFQLVWRSSTTDKHDRLASPLIVKALPLASGAFVPCALWLNRAFPSGEVVLQSVAGSAAPFDLLVAPGDSARLRALAGKNSLREAFLHWLHARHKTEAIVP
ncbi:MAG: type III-B CRISPR module RAMP protein Cmr1 [Acidobacteriota bacterium]